MYLVNYYVLEKFTADIEPVEAEADKEVKEEPGFLAGIIAWIKGLFSWESKEDSEE